MVTVSEKVCSKCKEVKPAEALDKNKSLKSGLRSECKECGKQLRSEINRRSREKNKEARNEYNRKYWKETNYYEKNKDKLLQYQKEYKANNKDKCDKWRKEWHERNLEYSKLIRRNVEAKRRRQKENSTLTSAEFCQWVSEQDKVCHYCGVECDDIFHVDHYIPLAKEGRHEIDNFVISCPTCNYSKGCKMPEEFTKQMEEVA
jgi:5-methylcytosine-specific restriction endonuclease McrA